MAAGSAVSAAQSCLMAQKRKKAVPANPVPTNTGTVPSSYHPFSLSDKRISLVLFGLIVAVAAIFGRTYGFQFIDYDDPHIVINNRFVNHGFTLEGIRWAFTSTQFFYWQPLSWLSHMLDCQLFGLNPGPAHLVNVGLHLLNALLVFAFLRYVTGHLWRSAFVAAIFAIHPLRVESVAWVGERKDVLSGFF